MLRLRVASAAAAAVAAGAALLLPATALAAPNGAAPTPKPSPAAAAKPAPTPATAAKPAPKPAAAKPAAAVKPATPAAAKPNTHPDTDPDADPDAELSATYRSAGGPAVPWLLLPDGQIVVLPPGAVFRVGRSPDARIRLTDSRVSRWHAEFTHRDGGVQVRDLGSTNGTTVDGLVPFGPLTDGAVISVGGVLLTFHG